MAKQLDLVFSTDRQKIHPKNTDTVVVDFEEKRRSSQEKREAEHERILWDKFINHFDNKRW